MKSKASGEHGWSRYAPFFTGLSLLVVGAVIFRDFLFGNAILLYKDIGSDSLIDYYPWFAHFSDYIRNEGFPSWSFSVGMGQDILYLAGYLLLDPVTWLPKGLIAPALVYQHLAKILVAGLFFFRFLRLRGLELPASLLGSLLLSFSAYMSMGSCWYILADEVVCFTALLLGAEEAIDHGRWYLLTLAVALVGFLGSFQLYLCALLLLFYVPARLFEQYGWQPRRLVRTCLGLAGAAVLGLGLGAFVTVPNFVAILNSPRGSGTASEVATLSSFPLFGLESQLHYITAALRLFANDLLGAGDGFRGWVNYFEAPPTYCGLICLALVPQAFVGATRRQRIIYAILLVALILPTLLPWFRHLFWLFQGNYYRTYSLFWVFAFITLSLTAFSRYLQGRSLNLWLLAATTIILVIILHLSVEGLQARIDPKLKLQATIILILYGIILLLGQMLKRNKLAGWMIVAVAAVELIQFNRTTVNRPTVTKQELKERVGYNDETVDAVRDIKASDRGFFRISKPRPSGSTVWTSLNDAMVFGYYGTSAYNSFNNVNYTNFLVAVGAMPSGAEHNTRWAIGLLNDPILSTFAGEKYALVDDPVLYQTILQYEFVKRYGINYLFRNQLFLPLGLSFNRAMTEEVFRQLPATEKSAALLRMVVVANANEAEKYGLSLVSADEVKEKLGATSFSDVVSLRRNSALNLTSFRQNRFTGTVQLDQKSILVLQTPFDRGWRALQDDKVAPTLKADVGLLGVALDAGEHKVELRYRTPFLRSALAISLVSLLFLALGAWRWPRLRLAGGE
jgi:uncharacterized membrane protein YfhO